MAKKKPKEKTRHYIPGGAEAGVPRGAPVPTICGIDVPYDPLFWEQVDPERRKEIPVCGECAYRLWLAARGLGELVHEAVEELEDLTERVVKVRGKTEQRRKHLFDIANGRIEP